MKKFLCLLLCLVMSCTLLVSCSDDSEIGDGIGDYPETVERVERLDLNMYIITSDDTTEDAKNSVSMRIAGYTKTMFNTELNVFYLSESGYEEAISAAINNGGANMPHIILVNSADMFNSLKSANKLVDLTSYYNSRDYGRLNTQIASALLQASKVDDGKLFSVPNNRVLGEYQYLVINKEVAVQTLKYGNAELSAYKSLDDAAALIEDIGKLGLNADDYVRVVNGAYEDRFELSEENFCNVIANPVVTVDDAFASAFAIVNTTEKYNDRAMQMIYKINTDITLRNILQYGVLGSNYTSNNGDFIRVKDGANTYNMNLIHTGDAFKANGCSEFGWNDAKKNYGMLQNSEAKFQ